LPEKQHVCFPDKTEADGTITATVGPAGMASAALTRSERYIAAI
jgi:hypothetical protein